MGDEFIIDCMLTIMNEMERHGRLQYISIENKRYNTSKALHFYLIKPLLYISIKGKKRVPMTSTYNRY